MIDESYSIFGFGSLAHVIAKFLAAKNILVESFIVEDTFRNRDVDGNANCLSVSEFAQKKDFIKKRVIFAVGYRDPKEKQLLFNRLDEIGINFVNLIFSKNCFINDDNIGRGNIFFPEAISCCKSCISARFSLICFINPSKIVCCVILILI